MYFTGFADEAASGIDGQIRATKELGWKDIESRNIDGVNIHDINEDAFDAVFGKLQDAGIRINCFGSAIANWSKSIQDPFDITLQEIGRALPRMQKLDCRLVRIMSYALIRDLPPDAQMVEERIRRLREIVRMFLDAGIQPVHENCMNYGGMGWRFTLELLEQVPGLKLVFDTGNPVVTNDYSKGRPYPLQDSWEFYQNVKAHIAYVHVKDCRFTKKTDGVFNEAEYMWPGDGDGNVRRILGDLLSSGYDGGISIEPHLSVVFHDKSIDSAEDEKYRKYVEYGRRLERLVAGLAG